MRESKLQQELEASSKIFAAGGCSINKLLGGRGVGSLKVRSRAVCPVRHLVLRWTHLWADWIAMRFEPHTSQLPKLRHTE